MHSEKVANRFVPCLLTLFKFGIFMTFSAQVIYGQALPPITSSGLNTQISVPVNLPGGVVQHNITGGTRPGGGANLFHSFGEFGVPTNNIANFLNDAALPTTNILSRVTGGNPSNILGTIQTQGFGHANLFLMNPAGIVFGPNASLNVGGSTHFTTADYLRLADGVQFTAMPSAQDALLSIAPVAAFGFLESNPASISVEGSTLAVSEGQTLSLVGGDITIGGTLNALGGQIALASVASPGEVLANTFASVPNVNGESFTTMGNIDLREGARLDVSGDSAGTVIIRGGELMIINARIVADTVENHGAPVAVDIQLSRDLTMSDTLGSPAITAQTSGSGDAGEVRISANNSNATSTSLDLNFSLIDTHTSGSGTAGNVNLMIADTLHSAGENAGGMYMINSGTSGADGGHGGNVTIAAQKIELTDANINTGDLIARQNGEGSTGSGGNLMIAADSVQLTGTVLVSDGFNAGKAGDISITARDVQLKDNTIIRASESGGGGKISIAANRLFMDFAGFEVETIDGIGAGKPWDGVIITAAIVELRNGSLIKSQTFGDGAAGNIRLTATDRLIFADDPTTSGTETNPSGLLTNSFGDVGGDQGPAGAILIKTGQLDMSGGARIDSTTQSSGRGGDVMITVTNGTSFSGTRPAFPFEESTSVLGSTRPSGIFSRTVGNEFCTGLCGDAGNVSIRTGSLNVSNGAAINSGTTSSGNGGTIIVNASDNISISGKIADGTPGGVYSRTSGSEKDSGKGGDIALTTEGGSFFLKNGATVSVSSSGPANAGDIRITAHETILIDKATVTTEAAKASGGHIKLTANDTIQLVDSTIESTVKGDAKTVAGNIELDPDFIILQNSHILAKAVDGQGGNIDLVANKGVLVDAQSKLEVTSERGISGTVNIESPIQVLSGTIVPLPSTPVNVATLYAARCVAGEGGHFSTFVDSKTDSVAPRPGTFLASPFLPLSNPTPAGTVENAGMLSEVSEKDQATHLQLASYAPPVLFAKADGMSSACP